MAKILGKKGALTKKSILEYQDYELYSKELIPITDDYEFLILEVCENDFLKLSETIEYKVLTESGICYLQTTENSLFLSDEQLKMKKGKLSLRKDLQITSNIKKSLIKIESYNFNRWDLYSSDKEIDGSFLNIFYDIKFHSLVKENFAMDLLKYTAWHPIFQDVVILTEPKSFHWIELPIL